MRSDVPCTWHTACQRLITEEGLENRRLNEFLSLSLRETSASSTLQPEQGIELQHSNTLNGWKRRKRTASRITYEKLSLSDLRRQCGWVLILVWRRNSG